MARRQPRPLPTPDEVLPLRYMTIDPGSYHRFHSSRYQPTEFNGTPNGRARFSPIRNNAGDIIPTVYAATSLIGAAMETIFRDLAHIPPPRHIDMRKFEGFLYSQIRVEQPLKLVDLTSLPLSALGMERRDLIDTDSTRYPYTQKWAEAIHAYDPKAQGLFWVSRQADTAQVIVLFGDRIPAGALSHSGQSHKVLHDEPTWSTLLDILDIMDVDAEF